MKKLCMVIALVLVLSFALGGCGQQAAKYENGLDKVLKTGKLVVSMSPDFAPMEFVDASKSGQEQYVGFDVTLAKYIADALGVELVIEAMDFTACQAAVSEGSVDISISGYSKLPEREENFNLSDYYYAGDNESEQCILILAANADSLKTKEDFAGKKVSAQNASLQMNLLTEQLPDAVANPIVDLNTAVMELINGYVDALCVAKGNGEAFIANYPELALSAFQFVVEDEGNVILIPKGEDELTAKINEILKTAYDAGLYGDWYADAEALAASMGIELD
ncbi:MAG TPA: transporter substrate-binding domain-containing protein [Clostridia bacterium]|nr:transporter substrate-binding domain-containing protein [Clostridia bacterium]